MQSFPTVLGIDPGKSGAIARLAPDPSVKGGYILDVWDMPVEPVGKKRVKMGVSPKGVAAIVRSSGATRALLEHVHSSPQMGVASAFSFGAAAMAAEGVCAALNIHLTKIVPSVWKPKIGAPADKTLSMLRATQLLPGCNVFWRRKKDDGRAEAAMLALYELFSLSVRPARVTSGRLNPAVTAEVA